ncbi:hypothetical protein ACI77I_06405 [Pseudomonas sp. D47]|uniref:hypothetical protein n=1 Tax=Pseudomonas sp. D47 TaxID=3159447 RepID=UPI00387B65F1
MTINASSNPVNPIWLAWQESIQKPSTTTPAAAIQDTQPHTQMESSKNTGRLRPQQQPANSLTQQKLNQPQAGAAEPVKEPAAIFTTLVKIPKSLTGAPVTHEFDNGNVKITSSPLHQWSFNGIEIQRNKVTIETGNKDDLVEIKTLTTGGVVAEINGKAYELPITNIGAMSQHLEIKTNDGNDEVNVADNIWFETTVSLNNNHRVAGVNGYISAPESANKKTFLEPGVIPVLSQMRPKGDDYVFKHGDVIINFTPNTDALQFGDGVVYIQTGKEADNVRIMAAEDGSMVADINGEKFLLPIKNDATGHSRLFISTQDGEDKIIIDSNVKNYSYILPGEDKSGSLYRGGGFTSRAEEDRQAQRYTFQNYNPVS